MKMKGPWKNATRLLRNYPKRLAYVRRRTTLDMAEVLYSYLMVTIPDSEDFHTYKESIKMVEIVGLDKSVAYAVISDRTAVKLGDLSVDEAMETVVYIDYKRGDMPPLLLQMVMQINPWPVEMVPNGLEPDTTVLIHRKVSKPEYEHVRRNAKEFVSANKDVIQGAGGGWGTVKEDQQKGSDMKSLPDFMSLALRAEFGINTPAKPHWKKSVRQVTSRLSRIMEDDALIQKALYDWLFKEHLSSPVKSKNTMSQDTFIKEAGDFQKKIADTLGGKLQ